MTPRTHTTIRPVPSLFFCTRNLQFSNENLSATFLWSIKGKTCSSRRRSGCRFKFSQPYIKMLCFLEWACISQYKATPQSSISLLAINKFDNSDNFRRFKENYLLIIALVFQIDGYVSLITVRYWRFKSRPVNELRVLPTITPSGLIIGTSLKINLWRSFLATYESLVMKSIKPFIIHELGASPGWTLAVMTTAFFFC